MQWITKVNIFKGIAVLRRLKQSNPSRVFDSSQHPAIFLPTPFAVCLSPPIHLCSCLCYFHHRSWIYASLSLQYSFLSSLIVLFLPTQSSRIRINLELRGNIISIRASHFTWRTWFRRASSLQEIFAVSLPAHGVKQWSWGHILFPYSCFQTYSTL